MRIPWSQDEAALLVDAYYRAERGELSIHTAVYEMSQSLRLMAINKGIRIDDKYRNANGIGMQMQYVKQVATQSNTGLTNGSKLLRNMVDLRANERKAFDLIMESALRSISGSMEPRLNQELSLTPNPVLRDPVAHYEAEEESHVTRVSLSDSFSTWMGTHIPENDQARMLQAFYSLGIFCRKAGIIKMPIVSITDTDEVVKIKQAVFSNKVLKIHNRKLLSDFKLAIILYEEYLTAAKLEGIVGSDAPVGQSIADSTQETTGIVETDEHSLVDFSRKGNYAYTNPLYATYRSERLEPIRTWKDAYIWIIGCLLRDYPDIVLGLIGRPLIGRSECVDIDEPKNAGKMRSPAIVSGKIAVETSLSASDLMNRTGILLRSCKIDLCKVTVAFAKHGQHSDKPKSVDSLKEDSPKQISPLLEPIRSVIAEHFPNGIRYASTIDRNKLKRAYFAMFSDGLPEDLDLPALLKEVGILHGDKVYVLTDGQKEKIRDIVRRLFDEGNRVICYSELMIHHAALLEEFHLYDAPLIRAVLKDLLPEAFCDEAWILAYKGASSIDDITHAFGDIIKLNYMQIKDRCPYLELGVIKCALSRSDRFVWTQDETFAQTHMIQLAQDEVEQVQSIFLPKMQADGFVSLNQLPLQESCDLNPHLSFMAVRDAMYIRHMATSCSKNGIIATPKGKTISSYDLMTAYCRSVDHATMSELEAYEQELTGHHASLILHAACYHMVRIDHNQFVCDESISFDADAVDHAIGLFVGDRVVPITAVSSFTSFPDVDGYEWNLYLVESFLRRFSRYFSIDGGPAQSSYVGGICPRAIRFETYEDRLAAAVIQDAVPLDAEAVGNYLTKKKFILRRSPMVKTVCDKALKIQEQRGTASV